MSERNPTFHVIAGMEDDIRNIARWGELIGLLGSSPHMIDPGVLDAISGPMKALGQRVEVEWEKAFRLAAGRNA